MFGVLFDKGGLYNFEKRETRSKAFVNLTPLGQARQFKETFGS
jgi:hypothetical protein